MPKINSYDQYPDVAKKINASFGGTNSRMPKWFAYSKNARHAKSNGKKKAFKKANQSIMNRICERFSHVGNMNMNCAGIPPFNAEMMIDEPFNNYEDEAVRKFCEMDASNMGRLIENSEMNDFNDGLEATYDNVRDQITDTLINDYGSLENVYPSIVQHLFTGANMERQSHKQMFWRVFGDMAMHKLEKNLVACRICPTCGMHLPLWSKHTCSEPQKKMLVCVDCGKTVERKGPKQTRCESCQKEHKKTYHAQLIRTLRKR